MNEILVRTNRNFYKVGDTVFGLVYLNIVHPTTGRGVKISVDGISKVSYGPKLGQKNPTATSLSVEFPPALKAEKIYINCQDVVLFATSDCLMLDSYILPFKFSLPSQIPGSMTVSGQNEGGPWDADVNYTIKAVVTDATDISSTESFQVRTLPPADYPLECTAECSASFLKFLNRKFSVTARLEKAAYMSGSDAMLNLQFKNTYKSKIKEINIKLHQVLTLRTRAVSRQTSITGEEYELLDLPYIIPYGTPDHIIWQTSLENDNEQFSKNFTDIPIPLVGLPPTTGSELIKCFYSVAITVTLQNKKSVSLQVPGPHILPTLDVKWTERQFPEWTNRGKTKLPNVNISDNFRVSSSTLYGEEFFGLPGFLPL